jgi:hypothetical protein
LSSYTPRHWVARVPRGCHSPYPLLWAPEGGRAGIRTYNLCVRSLTAGTLSPRLSRQTCLVLATGLRYIASARTNRKHFLCRRVFHCSAACPTGAGLRGNAASAALLLLRDFIAVAESACRAVAEQRALAFSKHATI